MVSGHHVHRGRRRRELRERQRPLEFAVTGPLRQIARDDDGVGTQVGNHLFHRRDRPEVGESPEVEVGQVQELDGHDST